MPVRHEEPSFDSSSLSNFVKESAEASRRTAQKVQTYEKILDKLLPGLDNFEILDRHTRIQLIDMVIQGTQHHPVRIRESPEVIEIEDSPEPPVHDEDIPIPSRKEEELDQMLKVWLLSVSTEEDSVF
jgi:Fic family protein